MLFIEYKFLYLIQIFLKFVQRIPKVNLVWDNGLAPNMRHAINWGKADQDIRLPYDVTRQRWTKL